MNKFNGKRSIFGLRPDKMITLKQVGAIYVDPCGHNYDPRNHPRHQNCEHCWKIYFDLHRMDIVTARSMVRMFGEATLVKKYGTKYAKWVKKFIEELNAKDAQEALEDLLDTQHITDTPQV